MVEILKTIQMDPTVVFIKKGTQFIVNQKFKKEIQWGGMSSAFFKFKKGMMLTVTSTKRTPTVIYMECPECTLGEVRMEYQEIFDALISKTLGILIT